MKHILRLAMTSGLILIIAATSFAVANPYTWLKPVNAAGKQTTMRKNGKYSRFSRKNIGNKKRISTRRTYRLTERQRRYWNQRLLDIYIN